MDNRLFLYTRNKFKALNPDRYWINKNTPVGEPATFWEYKPCNGRRYIPEKEILGEEYGGKFRVESCYLTTARYWMIQECADKYKLEIDKEYLFHNGAVLTTWEEPFKSLKNEPRTKSVS